MPIIKLQSSDGEVFRVDFEIAKASVMIKTLFEELDEEHDEFEDIVPLPEVNACILKKVIQWITYHKDDSHTAVGKLSSWDADFLKLYPGTILDIMTAANYLHINRLSYITGYTLDKMIEGKTEEEIDELFNIKNDFTPAEEELVREENSLWK